MIALADRRDCVPPINAVSDRPTRRLHRTRRRGARTPVGAVYVGRPTLWSNPFAGRPRIGHARGVILYRSWVAGDLSIHVLERAGFSASEIEGLGRWRRRLLERLSELAGHDLQCWCPLTSDWCHADVLLRLARAASKERVGVA